MVHNREYMTSPFVVQEVADLSAARESAYLGGKTFSRAGSGFSQRVQRTEGSSRASEGELVPAIVSAPAIGAVAK